MDLPRLITCATVGATVLRYFASGLAVRSLASFCFFRLCQTTLSSRLGRCFMFHVERWKDPLAAGPVVGLRRT